MYLLLAVCIKLQLVILEKLAVTYSKGTKDFIKAKVTKLDQQGYSELLF